MPARTFTALGSQPVRVTRSATPTFNAGRAATNRFCGSGHTPHGARACRLTYYRIALWTRFFAPFGLHTL